MVATQGHGRREVAKVTLSPSEVCILHLTSPQEVQRDEFSTPLRRRIRNCAAGSILARSLQVLVEVLWGFPLDLKNGPEEGPAFLDCLL